MKYKVRQNNSGRKNDNSETRINHRIKISPIRVVMHDGTQLGVIPTYEALQRAEELGLDLVEVQPNVRPPVCKIMDYGKFKYEQKKNANSAKKKQHTVELKEIKFRPKTDTHDFNVKIERIKKFLGEGNRVKVTVMFRGREIVHTDIGRDIMNRVISMLGDSTQVEKHPSMEGRSMSMILGASKKSLERAA